MGAIHQQLEKMQEAAILNYYRQLKIASKVLD